MNAKTVSLTHERNSSMRSRRGFLLLSVSPEFEGTDFGGRFICVFATLAEICTGTIGMATIQQIGFLAEQIHSRND